MQQWELLASPGHVLLARVDEYRRKVRLPVLVIVGAALTTLAAAPVAYSVAKGGGTVVEWVVRKVGGVVATPPAKSLAPELKTIRAVVPQGFSTTLDVVPDLESAVLPAMQAQVVAAQSNKRLDECDFSRKIDADWASAGDISPRCRYSTDGSRLWVWSLVKSKGQLRPWMGLISKREGKFSFQHVAIPNGPISEREGALSPSRIPRALAQDFPELVTSRGAEK